ncbi:hypothetical protein [Streptomyces asiaticus]|uniref:hypothetical protein n=1 Tax=Streptomyces asiaticus TaxID=114695 RepID=UPI003F67BB90
MNEPEPLYKPLDDWARVQAQQPLTGPVELYEERQPVIYVPGPNGQMVAVLKEYLPTVPAPVPAPPPAGFDPVAQRVLGGGIGIGTAAAGVGWGVGQATAGISSGSVVLFLAALLAWRATRRGGDTYITNNHTTNRWWGKSSTGIRNH